MAPRNTYGLIQQALERARMGRAPVLGFQPPRPPPGLEGLVLPAASSGIKLPPQEMAGAAIHPSRLVAAPSAVPRRPGGGVQLATDAIGFPRAALVSSIKETIDLGQDVIGLLRFRGWGGESSPSEWWRQASSNYGFGDLIHDERNAMGWGLAVASPFTGVFAPVVAGMGAAILADNIWADRVVGLIGDVALDPLTYMGGVNIMARGIGGAKTLSIALKSLKADDIARMAAQAGKQGDDKFIKALGDAINKGVTMSAKGRTVSSMSRVMRETPAGTVVSDMMGMSPGMRLRLPGTGAVGRTFAQTPMGRAASNLFNKVPQKQFLDEWMLKTRVANIPQGMRFGLGDDAIKDAVKVLRGNREAARRAVRADPDIPLWKRPYKVWEQAEDAALAGRQALDPQLARLAGRVARSHVEKAVPKILPFGAAGTQLAGAVARTPLLGERLFGRADLPLQIWRNMPLTGTIKAGRMTTAGLKEGADGVRMFSRFGKDFSERLQNILKPSEWNRIYAENPGLAREIEGGLTKIFRNTMSPTDDMMRQLLDSGDPDQIVRAWSAEQSGRYARGQRSFFREVTRKMRDDIGTRTEQAAKAGSLPRNEHGQWLLKRWLLAAAQEDVLILDDMGRITGINRGSKWWRELPSEVQEMSEKELIGFADTQRRGFTDLDKTTTKAFGDLDPETGEYLWADAVRLVGEEGAYFPRRVREPMRKMFHLDFGTGTTETTARGRGASKGVIETGTGRHAFEGGYRTSQSMKDRSWKPGRGIKLTQEAVDTAHPDYKFKGEGDNWWLGNGRDPKTGKVIKFRIENPQTVGLAVETQIDRVSERAFGQLMYEPNVLKVLDSYMSGMSMNVATESLMSHMKNVMGFDDMFRLPDDIIKQFQKVAVEGGLWGGEGAARSKEALAKRLASIRARTRRLYAVSEADFEQVVWNNERIARKAAEVPSEEGVLPLDDWALAEVRRQGAPDTAAEHLKNAWRNTRTAALTEDTILAIHRLAVPGVRPGYRTTPVTFASGGTATPAQHVPRQMTQLMESGLAHTDPEAFVREFLQIHPFEDGNGRVAVVLLNHLNPSPAGMRPLPHFFDDGTGRLLPPTAMTSSARALQGAKLWQAMNENLVRVYGEMEGITEELAHAGARLNQIYVDNEAAILAGTYKMGDDVRDLIIRIHDRAARAFEIQDDLIVMGQSQATAVEAVRLGNTGGVNLDMLDDAFKQMLRSTEISVAYVKGEGGYIGQFPLAVQQAKMLAAGDESITQLIRLAETLDPARAAQLADDAVAAGTPPAAARMPGKWAKIRASTIMDTGTSRVTRFTLRPYKVSDGNIDINITFPEPSVSKPYARTAHIEWGSAFWPRPTVVGRARHALPGLKRLDEIVQELSDEGFAVTAQASGRLLKRYRRHGFVDDPNFPRSTDPVVAEAEDAIAEGMVNIVKYPAKQMQRTTPYEKWEDAFKAAKTADKAVGHQEFISVGVRDGIDMDEANKLMQLIDRDISSMAETVRFDDVLQSIKRTAVPKGRTATPPSRGFETVDVPEPLVRPGEAPSVGERIVPGQPMAQYEHITSQDVLTAATAARDEARVVFGEARTLRDRLAVLEQRLAGDKAAGAPIARLKREVRLVKDQAATAEIYAQSRARDAADLLDMTRVERAGEPFEDFFSRPWDKRDPKQIETFIDAVQDGTANFGPWRIVSGDDALDSNMVAAAEAFQRLIALKDQAHGFWKQWDKLTNWFKAGLIATPGFMYRNMFGAFLNAYLDGVNPNQIIRSANTVSRINKVAEKQNISFMHAARDMADESPYMKDFVTLLEQGGRGGGQATQSVNPYASTGEEGILGAIGLGRWGRGMTRGSSEAQNVPSGLRGPGRLIKSVADVTWESVPGTAQRGTLRNIGTVLPVGPGSSNWAYNKAIRSANMQMEDVIRLGVGMDTLRWGGTPQDALERIALSQFDYGELTETEQTIRRWVPFYTWTRKNVPYQFNKLVTNPAAYNRVMSVKRNMELGTEDEGVVPDWFMHPFGIRLPWEWGGARVYTTPDLPFADLFRYDPTRKIEGQGGIIPSGITEVKDNMLWQLSPIAKIPLEMAFGESLRGGFNFTGKYQTMPLVFSEMAGAPVMRGLANAVPGIRKRDGEWQIRDYLLYFLSSALPALSLSRRLMPTEERYQQRFIETIFSTIFGVSIQRQTPEVEEKWANRLENHLRREEARQRRDDGGRSSLLPPTVGSDGGGTSRVFP